MSSIQVVDDEGQVLTWKSPTLDVFAAVMHALTSLPATSVEQGPQHFSRTGACSCTSFSQTIAEPMTCLECGHPVHNSRTFCGALR